MRAKLASGDRVAFRVNGRRFKGTVQDVLPFMAKDAVPVLKRTKTVWIDRSELRKLPNDKTNPCS